jgi:CBS domain-containing protein
MGAGSELPTVAGDGNVFAALEAVNRERSGASLILKTVGSLAGIFTHDDFTRNSRSDPLLGGKSVGLIDTHDLARLKIVGREMRVRGC